MRHGLVYNPTKIIYGALPGFGLDPEGLADVDATAARLAEFPVARIYTSPLQRAKETVARIQQQPSLASIPVYEDERLREWVFVSQGLTYPELIERYPDEFEQYKKDPTKLPAEINGVRYETFSELETRMVDCIEAIRAAHPNELVLIVSHGDPIIMAMAHYVGDTFWHTKEAEYPRVAQTRTLHFADDKVTITEWPQPTS